MNDLERRVIELSYKFKLTHISSCLNCINLIDWIYRERKPYDPFCLGNGHAGLALYICLEKYGFCNAEEMIKKHGVHPNRDMPNGIYVSSGSLGQAETVAVGLALADKNRKVWLVTSDGACAEGSVHEALRVGAKYCPNLETFVVFNGYGAYGKIYEHELPQFPNVRIHNVDTRHYPDWLCGLNGHYLVLNSEQYGELMV
jgi:transketolase N-terminal domain/subunit